MRLITDFIYGGMDLITLAPYHMSTPNTTQLKQLRRSSGAAGESHKLGLSNHRMQQVSGLKSHTRMLMSDAFKTTHNPPTPLPALPVYHTNFTTQVALGSITQNQCNG